MPSEFAVDAGDGNTPILHEMKIKTDTLKLTMFNSMGLMGGPDVGNVVHVNDDLKGEPGETVNIHFVPYADEDPILGQDVSIENNLCGFQEFRDSVTVDQVTFAFGRKGLMTEQRTIVKTREQLSSQVSRHFAQYNDTEITKRLTGIALTETQTDWESSTDTTDRVNGGGRCIRASGSNSYATVTEANSDNTALVAAIATTDKLNPRAIMGAGVEAKTSTASTYQLQPIKIVDNSKKYIMLVHPKAKFDLMVHPEWLSRAIEVSSAGLDDDPIAKGALGIIDNVIVREFEFITRFQNGSSEYFARNLLLGESAVAVGWAKELFFVEELLDFKTKLGIAGFQLRGETKLAFTDKDNTSADIDYGVMQVVTAAN